MRLEWLLAISALPILLVETVELHKSIVLDTVISPKLSETFVWLGDLLGPFYSACMMVQHGSDRCSV